MENIDTKDKLILGVLSGTSIDSVDIVLISISGFGKETKFKVLNYEQYPIISEIKEMILNASDIKRSNVEMICTMNYFIGRYFASKILNFLKKYHLSSEDIFCIGSHGQTVYHYPHDEYFGDLSRKSSLQLGDISVIANLTNINTVGDFRAADISVGGSGAPLVPYLDYILFPSDDNARLILNIGGISNFTYLEVYCQIENVIAFDTGPGNMLIDAMMKKLYNREYDENGRIACSGEVQHSILQKLAFSDSFLLKPPPKSTGREDYGEKFLEQLSGEINKYPREDIIASITEYTTFCIKYNFENYINKIVDELIVSGGGAKNEFIMDRLKRIFPKSKVKTMNYNGITVENKEAVLFAVLANEAMHHNYSNVPGATGASRRVIQGKVAYVR